ncbi:methylated-DNA--protein-cysteine methyltransferase [Perognathus longimembris pacificus]|uniref:methylated-DNA--protein-cysteine methyltransferase n=1 Tax=Perognathus longimembris pacificus TaxID=214514 RepID=UPI0020197EAE|nr:methylated-DNA--protein-cysteine methyltransferase [Perognathus longimembris pacificus]
MEACALQYKAVDSPVGRIELVGCGRGLHEIRLPGGKMTGADSSEAPAAPEGTAEPLVRAAAWLDAYFHKPAALEELPLPPLHHPVFQKESFTRRALGKLLELVKFGETVSYQQLAALAGNPRAARAVGAAMRSNPVPILIPCHRVICSSGAPGNYSGGGCAVKERLLAHEGLGAGRPGLGGPAAPPAPRAPADAERVDSEQTFE